MHHSNPISRKERSIICTSQINVLKAHHFQTGTPRLLGLASGGAVFLCALRFFDCRKSCRKDNN